MNEFDHSKIPSAPAEGVTSSVYLYPGDYFFATEPTLIHTVLGSCVSVVLFDKASGFGAMCHAVLSERPPGRSREQCSKFIDCVLPEMIRLFADRKIPPTRLIAKIFGGASLFKAASERSSLPVPGEQNVMMAKKILKEFGCKLVKEDCGGSIGRKIYFYSHTGDVFQKRIKKVDLGTRN